MKLSHTIVYVRSVEQAQKFYEEAFGLERGFTSEDGQFGEMKTAGGGLGFVAIELAHDNLRDGFRENRKDETPPGFEIAFEVQDVDAAWSKAIRAGAAPYGKPSQKPWGQTIAYLRDQEGILVCLASPMPAG